MLNTETLQQQEELKELTGPQLNAIVLLANNTAKADIDAKVKEEKGKVFGRFDEDIKGIFGTDKEGNEPTHVYLKKAVEKWQSENNGADNSDKIKALEDANADLSAKIEAGAGNDGAIEAWKTKYNDVVSQIDLLKTDQDKLKTTYEAQLKEKDDTYHKTLINGAFDSVLSDIKFKSDEVVSKNLRTLAIQAAKTEVLNKYNTRFVDDGSGGKVLEFLDETGEILRNPENKREPFTAKELLTKGLSEVIDNGQHQGGGGSGGGGSKKGIALNLGAAKTQVEADSIITKTLIAQGFAKTDLAFNEKHTEMRNAAGVTKLPIS